MSKQKRKASKITIIDDGECIHSEIKDLDLNDLGPMLGDTLLSICEDIAENISDEEASRVLFASLADILETVGVSPGTLTDYILFLDSEEFEDLDDKDFPEESPKKSEKGNIKPIPISQMQEKVLRKRKDKDL